MIELQGISDKALEQVPKIALGLLVLFGFVFLSWMIKNVITKRVNPKTKNPLLAVLLGKIVAFIITVTGFVIFLNIIGWGGIATHIMAGAGITTFVIGFAFKDIGKNFLAGPTRGVFIFPSKQ